MTRSSVNAAASPAAPLAGAPDAIQRPAAEVLYADEVRRLAETDGDAPRPAGWRLTPRSVLAFVQLPPMNSSS